MGNAVRVCVRWASERYEPLRLNRFAGRESYQQHTHAHGEPNHGEKRNPEWDSSVFQDERHHHKADGQDVEHVAAAGSTKPASTRDDAVGEVHQACLGASQPTQLLTLVLVQSVPLGRGPISIR